MLRDYFKDVIRDPKLLVEICKYCGIRRGQHESTDKCPIGDKYFKKDK